MIKWTFSFDKETAVAVTANTEDEDKFLQQAVTSEKRGLIHVPLENGQQCFFNLNHVKLVLREVLVAESNPIPPVIPNEVMTETELKETYAEMP